MIGQALKKFMCACVKFVKRNETKTEVEYFNQKFQSFKNGGDTECQKLIHFRAYFIQSWDNA